MSYIGGGVAYLDDYEIDAAVASPQLQEVYHDLAEHLAQWLSAPYTRDTSLVSSPDAVNTVDALRSLLEAVESLHWDGKPSAAADRLLNRVVELLENGDFASIDCLMELLQSSLQNEPRLYDARGLARIHNVLAMTFDFRGELGHRALLKSRYRDAVAASEGPAVAERTTNLL